jgi:hypothetical protein
MKSIYFFLFSFFFFLFSVVWGNDTLLLFNALCRGLSWDLGFVYWQVCLGSCDHLLNRGKFYFFF